MKRYSYDSKTGAVVEIRLTPEECEEREAYERERCAASSAKPTCDEPVLHTGVYL